MIQPGLDMSHLMEECVPELRFAALSQQIDIERQLDRDTGALRGAVATDMTQAATHPVTEPEWEVGWEPAAEVGPVVIPVEFVQELALGGCAAAAPGAGWMALTGPGSRSG
jgi:hypothetical protein